MKYSSVCFHFILGPVISLSTISLVTPLHRDEASHSHKTANRHTLSTVQHVNVLPYRSDISEPTHSLRTSTRYASRFTEYGNSTEWF